MKRKRVLILIIPLLLISMCSITQAKTTYDITVSQNPIKTNVKEGQVVVVTANLYPTEGDAENVIDNFFSPTELRWYKNNIVQTKIKCNQALPRIASSITFTLGAFVEGDTIKYRVYLGLDNADDYVSSEIVFNVLAAQSIAINLHEPDLIEIIIIVVSSVLSIVAIISIVILIKRKKKRNKTNELADDTLRKRISEATKERLNKPE